MITLEHATIIEAIREFTFPEVDLVIGIGTGGMVPAAMVAYKLIKPLVFVNINYRDETNQPRYAEPVVLEPWLLPAGVKRALIVDDVAVTGKTLETAKGLFGPCQVETFVLKGQADYVLFPQIKDCVDWPWKKLRR